MMEYIRPFQVVQESSQTLAVTASSQAITLPTRNGNASVRIVVVGTQNVFWRLDGAAAVATSTPMLANTVETFFLSRDATTINFIAAATGTTVYITIGESA
jgi:hypothetical protein